MTSTASSSFSEAPLGSRPIRDLGLTICGSSLEPILSRFEDEIRATGLKHLRSRFYLSTEWGVPEGTVAIAIPFYLARADLTALHADREGHVEGHSPADILRYLRHEFGHVVNYAYRLYDTEAWIERFGAITQPYREDYRPEPFSRRFVRHLPGWYAQKHPDEDWAETFAVWMTPAFDWRTEYAEWPVALAKLEYCDQTLAELADRKPIVTAEDLDLDVGEISETLDEFYTHIAPVPFPPGLAGALKSIFEDLAAPEGARAEVPRQPASALIRRLETDLSANIFRWTGHFPERTRPLLRHLAELADRLGQVYAEDHEETAIVALSCLVTTLATNAVRHGAYVVD